MPGARAHLHKEAAVIELARHHVHVAAAQEDAEALGPAPRHLHCVLEACGPKPLTSGISRPSVSDATLSFAYHMAKQAGISSKRDHHCHSAACVPWSVCFGPDNPSSPREDRGPAQCLPDKRSPRPLIVSERQTPFQTGTPQNSVI